MKWSDTIFLPFTKDGIHGIIKGDLKLNKFTRKEIKYFLTFFDEKINER